jgi:hypothetical protein
MVILARKAEPEGWIVGHWVGLVAPPDLVLGGQALEFGGQLLALLQLLLVLKGLVNKESCLALEVITHLLQLSDILGVDGRF